MASSTTNLDLTLPVGGENVSRQIINANNVKIDEAVGAVPSGTDLQSQVDALNNNVKVHDLGTISTLSAFQSALDTMVAGITGVGQYVFEFTAYFNGAGFTPFNVSNSQIFGKLTIAGTSRYNVEVYNHANINRIWRGTKLVDTWSWDQFALKSDIVVQPCSVPSVDRSGDLNQAISVTYNTSYSSKTNMPIPIGFYLVDGWGGINGHRAYLKNYSKTGVVVDLTFASNDVRNNINFTVLSVVLYVRD